MFTNLIYVLLLLYCETITVASGSLARPEIAKITIPIYGHYRSFAVADNMNTLVAAEVDARCPGVHDLLSSDGEDHGTSAVHFTPMLQSGLDSSFGEPTSIHPCERVIRQNQISKLDNIFPHCLCLLDFGEHSG